MLDLAVEVPSRQVELEESAHATLDRCRESRPANTARAYEPKQREFKAWCDRKKFHETTRYQVSASKLHLFLREEVVYREVRVKNSQRKIGVATVDMYVSAMSDLYSDQQTRGVNSLPHPRNSWIKALLSTLKQEKREKNANMLTEASDLSWMGTAPQPIWLRFLVIIWA